MTDADRILEKLGRISDDLTCAETCISHAGVMLGTLNYHPSYSLPAARLDALALRAERLAANMRSCAATARNGVIIKAEAEQRVDALIAGLREPEVA